jgi:SAM-dependent methyltransferase
MSMQLSNEENIGNVEVPRQANPEMGCISCGKKGPHRVFAAEEKMFSIGERFEYFKCDDCGSLQIINIPADLGRHYPSDYYSMVTIDEPILTPSWLRLFVRAARTECQIRNAGPVAWTIGKIAPDWSNLNWSWFRGYVSTSSRILDVGCGGGQLLRDMHAQGFRRLTGVDPFIARSINAPGLRILRGELSDLQGDFDFVMFNHSLEHMPDPLSALRSTRRLLGDGGAVLVRLPVANSSAELQYGPNWIGLDPPRHLVVPSRAGMNSLAQRAGLRVERYWSDTTEWTLLVSQTITRGLPYYDRQKKSFFFTDHFTEIEIEQARKRAAALNSAEDGDTGCYILRAA